MAVPCPRRDPDAYYPIQPDGGVSPPSFLILFVPIDVTHNYVKIGLRDDNHMWYFLSEVRTGVTRILVSRRKGRIREEETTEAACSSIGRY